VSTQWACHAFLVIFHLQNVKFFSQWSWSALLAVAELMFQCCCRCTDGFIGLTTIGINMTSERLCWRIISFFENVQCKLHDRQTAVTCELMVHPGYRCRGLGGCGGPYGPDDFACSDEREHELNILNSDKLKAFYLKQNFKLCPTIL